MDKNKDIKKKIAEDWLFAFPQLTAYTSSKLYKIVGCCIMGIELIKLPYSEEYRPHFVIYALWKTDLKTCFKGPLLMIELYNKKGLQFNIPYAKHEFLFSDAVERFKKQITIPMNGDVTLKILFKLIDCCFDSDILIKVNPVRQALLSTLKFYSSLYAGGEPEKILKQIVVFSKKWDMPFLETQLGAFDLWLQTLNDEISHRDAFINQIEANKQKIKKMHNSELLV